MPSKKAIGIDLGTSKCCVGFFRDGKVEILENESGNKTTPSYVAFTDTERLFGDEAKDQVKLNPGNTVFAVKRIISRETNDALLKEAVVKMPYTIMDETETENGVRVSYKGTKEVLLPQQITAMLLGKMKGVAENHLKSSVEDAVISVPASFTNAQRQATKDAAAIAGLNVLALINGPTAAAIAYQANMRKTDEENVAVVDFGAGNLDVAIVTVRRGRVSVRAVSGSAAIGGNDIDEVLMNYVSSKFEEKHRQKPPESSAMTERLRLCCEKLKLKLSLLPKVQETLDCFGDDNELPVTITRADFNEMVPAAVHSSLNSCLQRVIEASRIPVNEISRVVLVGGSSRIPQFQTWIEEIFSKKSLDKSVNPDEAVACGAAVYAALLSRDNELEDIIVNDCVSNEYLFSWQGDSAMHPIFEQHSCKTLPQRRKFPFTLLSPFNKTTQAHTFELHEDLSGQKNPHRLIGTVCLDDEFRQAVRLITGITFEVDRCGIFNVVVQLDPVHEFPEVVKNYVGKLSKGKLQNAIEREQQFRRDDQDERERVEAMSSLDALSYRLGYPLRPGKEDSNDKELFPELVKQICDKAKENVEWLDDAPNTVTKAECLKRVKTLEKLNHNLKLQRQEHKKKEDEHLAAIKRLTDYLLELEAFLTSNDVSEEREHAADIERYVAKTKQWLRSTEIPSTNKCTEIIASLMKLRNSLENRLEEKRQEIERVTARENLLEYWLTVLGLND